jgi:hypothetical protein
MGQAVHHTHQSSIYQIILALWDGEITSMSIMIKCSICCSALPPTEDILKSKIEGTASKAILRKAPLAIVCSIMLCCRWARVEMSTIHSTKSTLKERKELGIIEDFRWDRVICRGKFDIFVVKCW